VQEDGGGSKRGKKKKMVVVGVGARFVSFLGRKRP